MQVDHIVILLPYADIQNPPDWVTSHFHVSPGGRHGDNKTENKLILFHDGSYLELIAFINDDPEKRKGHWWDKPYGVVDYAFTTGEPLDVDKLNSRLDGFAYNPAKEGGRKKPDGSEIRWQVVFPKDLARGTLPFFCNDLTPRQRRVPITEENTAHPCGAIGVGEIAVAMDPAVAVKANKAVSAIVENRDNELDTPVKVPGLHKPKVKIMDGASGSELQLSIVLQTQKKPPPDPIEKRIDDGVVRIAFE